MTNKLEISRELAERLTNKYRCTVSQLEIHKQDIEELRALLAAPVVEQVPPLIQTLHANGDRIAMEATIAQQAQRIADLEAAPVVERQAVAWEVYWADNGEYYFTSRNKERARKLIADPDFKIVPLYAERPAPVAVVLDRYTCIGKGGDYEYLGLVTGAGTLSAMSPSPVYRDASTGKMFIRTPLDFNVRMQRIDKVKELNQ